MITADEWMGMYHIAADRADKAEADVERLKLMVTSITGGLDEAIETVQFLEAENAQLRKAVEAAREYMTVFDETPGYYESLDECVRLKEVLRQALADLDEGTNGPK